MNLLSTTAPLCNEYVQVDYRVLFADGSADFYLRIGRKGEKMFSTYYRIEIHSNEMEHLKSGGEPLTTTLISMKSKIPRRCWFDCSVFDLGSSFFE